jgi:putative flippase GtrA
MDMPPSRTRDDRGHQTVIAEFFRFGSVGALGFLVDTATVYALAGALGLYGAGVIAYLVAASANWALNRVWTFRGRGRGHAVWQWARFLVTNAGGFVVNRGVYAALIAFFPLVHAYPVLAVAAGAVAGMGLNFFSARRFVFR